MDITIVVFAGPDVSSLTLDDLGDHIVDESVLIPEFLLLELGLVGVLVEGLEDILESTVIFLEDGIFSGHVEGIVAAKGVFEASMSEGFD